MDNDLQAALDLAENFFDGTDYHFDRLTPDEQSTIVEAARLVANPNIEAATQAVAKHLHDMFPDIPVPETSAQIAKDAVAAALTPRGNTA